MKKIIVAVAATAFFSTIANADSGLADRINEARSFPNKTIESSADFRPMSMHRENMHMNMSKTELKRHHKKMHIMMKKMSKMDNNHQKHES